MNARIRIHIRVLAVEQTKGATLIRKGYAMELEADCRPVLVTDMLTLAYS
jgi:hypothetical protein